MLEEAFIVAFIVYFIKATTWKGMIFYPLAQVGKRVFPDFIQKPLFDCPVCMTPWWGALVYVIAFCINIPEFETLSVGRVIFTVFVASGINTVFLIFNKIYDILIRIRRK